jgi:hypothetical protein
LLDSKKGLAPLYYPNIKLITGKYKCGYTVNSS